MSAGAETPSSLLAVVSEEIQEIDRESMRTLRDFIDRRPARFVLIQTEDKNGRRP